MWVQASCAHELKRKRRNTKLKVTQSPGGVFFCFSKILMTPDKPSREASPELKSHFYPRLASCAAKKHFNCFPFSRSHKASSLPEYTNYHPFFLHTTENNCKLRLSKRSPVCSAQFEVILVSQQSEGKIKDGC